MDNKFFLVEKSDKRGKNIEQVCVIKGQSLAREYCELMCRINIKYQYSYSPISVYGVD